MEYPNECLPESSIIVDSVKEKASVITGVAGPDTHVFPLGKYIQVSVNFARIRIGETAVVPIFLKLPRGRVPEGLAEFEGEDLARRIVASKLISGVVIHASAWSANAAPVAAEFIVVAASASRFDELTDAFADFAHQLWDRRKPESGLYFRARPWRRMVRRQLAEVILLPEDPLSGSTLDPSIILRAEHALAWITLPPWGYKGQSFDVKEYAASVRVKS